MTVQVEQDTAISAADMIRALALGCPGVAGMSGATRSYFPGRTVAGITENDRQVDVRVIARYGTPLLDITVRLSGLLVPVLAGRGLHVHIDDIVLPGEPVPSEAGPGAAVPPGAGRAPGPAGSGGGSAPAGPVAGG